MYHYRITVESLGSTAKAGVFRGLPQVGNHDDLFKIVAAIRSKEIRDEDKSAALAIGLKLLSEIVLEKRRDPLFEPMGEPIRSFIRQLKAVRTSDAVEHGRELVNTHSRHTDVSTEAER